MRRVADVDEWARRGEDLLDLRRQGPFKGRGVLRQYAEQILLSAWEKGSAEEASEAISKFRSTAQREFPDHF